MSNPLKTFENIKNVLNSKAILAGLLAVVLWAAIPALVKTGIQSIDISLLLLLRFLISSAVMIPLLPRVLKNSKNIRIHLWAALLVVLGANYYFQALAMAAVPVSWYTVIFSLNPILALLIIRVPFQRKMIIPLFIAIVGTFLFVNEPSPKGKIDFLSILFLVIGMLTWVFYTRLVTEFHKIYSDAETTALTQFVSLVAILPIAIWKGVHIQSLSSGALFSVLTLGATTPFAYFGFSYCLRKLPVFGVVSQYLEPVVGIIIGVCFFSESLSSLQIMGSAAIIFSMVRLASH